jgi:hypothetical protein
MWKTKWVNDLESRELTSYLCAPKTEVVAGIVLKVLEGVLNRTLKRGKGRENDLEEWRRR